MREFGLDRSLFNSLVCSIRELGLDRSLFNSLACSIRELGLEFPLEGETALVEALEVDRDG